MSYTYEYPRPALTVDAIIFTKEKDDIFVLLIQRDNPPFEGMWAFPGGFVDMDETLEHAAIRELEEETGIIGVVLKQFYVFDAINRDPRHRTVSVVFTGMVLSKNIYFKANDDARNVRWFNVKELPSLAFDHNEILAKSINDLFG
jgi:8-oxo-dGTP diphosphatase